MILQAHGCMRGGCCHGLNVEGHLTQSPTPRRPGGKPPKPIPFRVQDLNSVRSILVNNNTFSFVYAEGPDSLKEVWRKPRNLLVLMSEVGSDAKPLGNA